MNRYSAQPGDSYGFLPFAKNVTKNVYGSIKNNKQFKKHQHQLVIWLTVKLLKLKIKQRIKNLIKKYLKKDVYLQKKDRTMLWSMLRYFNFESSFKLW